eukprot:365309-Chlamydomonas_euryale.AAC.13
MGCMRTERLVCGRGRVPGEGAARSRAARRSPGAKRVPLPEHTRVHRWRQYKTGCTQEDVAKCVPGGYWPFEGSPNSACPLSTCISRRLPTFMRGRGYPTRW